jgi:hypothetical protein
MFLSILWAVLTSDATTKAFIGCFSCCPILCANWFVPPCPTILKDGADAPPILGACMLGVLPPPAPIPPDILFAEPIACFTAPIIPTA